MSLYFELTKSIYDQTLIGWGMYTDKKVLYFLGLSLLSLNVNAMEIERGVFEVEGGADFSYSTSDVEVTGGTDSDLDALNLSITGTFYVANNIGLGLIVGNNKTESSNATGTITTESFTFGPRVVLNKSLNPNMSAVAALSYIQSDLETKTSTATIERDASGWTLEGGIKHFFSQNVSVNGMVSYSNITQENNLSSSETTTKGLGLGASLSVYFW